MGKFGTAFDILRDVVFGKAQYMDLYEQTTLIYIFRRTRIYGKDWESIPLRHFMSGVWSRKNGCIAPRIRISETKLLEALASLESKTIIEIERRTARISRYRIREDREIEIEKVVQHVGLHQIGLVRTIVRELEQNAGHLPETDARLLYCWRGHLATVESRIRPKRSPISRARATARVELPPTSPVLVLSKKPILLKIPTLHLASRKPRRGKLAIKPLPVRHQST
jgi:hypothetical protein